jgi:predicted AlkP superfamily pyrophosphatase or phosphodiesterase
MQTTYILLLICLVGICKTAQTPSKNLLLIVLLDGFRYDYIEKYANPDGFLKNMSKNGIYAMYEPIFPTNTYPNYWTIVTGLYPESNGIINNDVYDPISKHQYRMGYDDENQDDWFRQAEPVWIQNERVNGKAIDKHSVVYDWAGAPAQFDNIRPYAHRG